MAVSNTVKILIDTLYSGKGTKEAVKDLKDLGKQGASSGTSLAAGFANATQVIGGSIAAITAVGVALDKALDIGAQGAQVTRLENSFQSLAQVAGVSGDELFNALDKAARGTVANTDLILSTNRAMMLGLGADADQLGQLMEVAAFRGRAMGLTTTQAFNDIVTGVGRGSAMILDNLGIVVDAEQTYKEYAAQIGKTASELTKAEKTQALLTRVIEEGNTQMEAAGGLADDTAASYERMDAAAKNWFDTLKKGVGESLKPVADNLTLLFDIETEVQRLMEQGVNPYEARRQAIENVTNATNEMADATKEAASADGQLADSRRESIETLRDHRDGLGDDTLAIEDNTEALKEQSDAYKAILSNMFRIQDISERFTEGEEERAAKAADIQAEQTRLAIEIGDLRAQGLATAEKENQFALQQIELQQEYNDLLKEGEQAIVDKEKATKELVYRQLEQRAAQDQLISTDELRFLQDTAVEMGLVDRASADMAIAAAEAADMMWEQFQRPGEAVGDIQAALDNVVKGSPYRAQIVVEQIGNIPSIGPSSGGAKNAFVGGPTQGRHEQGVGGRGGFAEGGSFIVPGTGSGDRPYIVPMEPGERVTITPKDGRGGPNVNINIANIRSLSDIDYMVQEISRRLG